MIHCMIEMPVDLDMYLSATRFDYSPFIDDRHSLSYHSTNLKYSRDHIVVKEKARRFGIIQDKPVLQLFEQKTLPDPEAVTEQPPDSSRKKKVSFADDKGMDLVEVREIPGGALNWSENMKSIFTSDQNWTDCEKKWRNSFINPPWKESILKDLIIQNNVVLESVCIKKDAVEVLSGTVKVKNLAYEKNVFVRVSFDRWVSYIDAKADYVKNCKTHEKHSTFDAFSFDVNIPPSAMKYGVIEFCVCFQCVGKVFWDNNGGVNYRIVADYPNQNLRTLKSSSKLSNEKITVSLTENIENFSEIDAWSNFLYNRPYW